MIRTATLAFDDLCRLDIGRLWDDTLPLAAWLSCNPSEANAEIDDQTVRRQCHFSRAAGCGGFIGLNYRPWRTPKPAVLWRAIKAGLITPAMTEANDDAIAAGSARASVHFVSFGVEPGRREPHVLLAALDTFQRAGGWPPLLCLGTSPDGWPLHPLARGRFAIRNDVKPQPWTRLIL